MAAAVVVAQLRAKQRSQTADLEQDDSEMGRALTLEKFDRDGDGQVSLEELKDHLGDILIRADILHGRLQFENNMCQMMLKLPLFIVCFACFLAALIEFAPSAATHDVHRHLKHHFSLDAETINNVKDVETLYKYMENFEHRNEELQATSAKYWCEHRYTDHHWDEKLAVPVTTCKSPRQYALSLVTDDSSAWTNDSVQSHHRRLAAGDVPPCEDYDEELRSKTGDMNTTCALAAVDSHHKVCEEDLGILVCPKTCGFCSPFIYDHKKDFTKPQVTMLPITVFQTRFAKSDCHGFAHTYEEQPHNPVLTLLPALDGKRNGRVLTCVDRTKHAETQYAHEVPCPAGSPSSQCPGGKLRYSHRRTYHGSTVYPKMLIEPHRDLSAMKAIQWIDLQTEATTLSTVVYTEDIEIFTLLEVEFRVDVAGNINGEYTMISYRDVIGQARVVFISCLTTCTAGSLMSLVVMAYLFFKRKGKCSWGYLCYEFFSRSVLLIYPAVLLLSWTQQVPMAEEYDQLLHTFLDIDGMSESHIDAAMESYFEVLTHVYDETSWLKRHRIAGYLIVYVQFLQFIFYMNAHPKMATLTATVHRSMNNLLHFVLLFAAIFTMLAFMAHWMLGEHIAEFGSFETAMFSQMQMFFGEFIKAEEADSLHGALHAMYWVYAWTFMLVIWLLLLNFLLAIIVDAFVEVKDQFSKQDFIADIGTDIVSVCHARIAAFRYHWPSQMRLIEFLEHLMEGKPMKRARRASRSSITAPVIDLESDNSSKSEEEDVEKKYPTCQPSHIMELFPEFQTDDEVARFLLHYYRLCPGFIRVTSEVRHSKMNQEDAPAAPEGETMDAMDLEEVVQDAVYKEEVVVI